MMEPVGMTGMVVVEAGAIVESVLPVIVVAHDVRAIAHMETLSRRLIFVNEKLRW
jgi:hypothetical protein